MRQQYRSLKLPSGLLDQVESHLEAAGSKYGYISVPDFIKTAIRRQLEEEGHYVEEPQRSKYVKDPRTMERRPS